MIDSGYVDGYEFMKEVKKVSKLKAELLALRKENAQMIEVVKAYSDLCEHSIISLNQEYDYPEWNRRANSCKEKISKLNSLTSTPAKEEK